MIVKVRRQELQASVPYWQRFRYEASGMQTVAQILETLNESGNLLDVDGRIASPVRWECSCLQKACGACAMVVNGKPCLACSEFVDTDTAEELVLEPLSKFPVSVDLLVDRSCLLEHQKEALMFLGSARSGSPGEFEQQYAAAKCLKCGLCLEACPNYSGEGGSFYGAPLANEAYLLHSLSADRRRELKRQYQRHFERGCSKSLACRDICPAHISSLASMSSMNSVRFF